jgi:hypothetical protein
VCADQNFPLDRRIRSQFWQVEGRFAKLPRRFGKLSGVLGRFALSEAKFSITESCSIRESAATQSGSFKKRVGDLKFAGAAEKKRA